MLSTSLSLSFGSALDGSAPSKWRYSDASVNGLIECPARGITASFGPTIPALGLTANR